MAELYENGPYMRAFDHVHQRARRSELDARLLTLFTLVFAFCAVDYTVGSFTESAPVDITIISPSRDEYEKIYDRVDSLMNAINLVCRSGLRCQFTKIIDGPTDNVVGLRIILIGSAVVNYTSS